MKDLNSYLLREFGSSSSMTGSFRTRFLFRLAEGVFGNKLILLTGLKKILQNFIV